MGPPIVSTSQRPRHKLWAIATAVFFGWLGVDRFVLSDNVGGFLICGAYILSNISLRSNIDALTITQVLFVLFGIARGVAYVFSDCDKLQAKHSPN